MIIIADSGSSKTDWCLLSSKGTTKRLRTAGLNPHVISKARFSSEIQNSELLHWATLAIEKIYFYGAGITNGKQSDNIISWLQPFFNDAEIFAASDLLGAARAVFGSKPGIIGILGTGSNSGHFNGTEIIKNIPPLGFVLGDEGSGNAIGKRLVTSYLRNELPVEIVKDFNLFYPDHKNLLSNIYLEQQPARLLASFMPFVHTHKSALKKMISDEFIRYFNLLNYYDQNEVALIGAVAYYFNNILDEVADKQGKKLIKAMKSPIEDLSLYHQAEIL